jgi:glucosamine kinase
MQMTMRLFIGVDGGGSRCGARLVGESGRVLGEGKGGPANARLGEPAFAEVMTACREAIAAAGLSEADLKRVHAGFGLAGAQQDRDRDFILRHAHPFASLAVDTDGYASWLGAFRGRDGAILILGTGVAGLAVIGGRRINVSGWGAEIGDEGSGMAIGRMAIRQSLWALDGMIPMTPLASEVLDFFGRSGEAAVTWADNATPGDYGRFAPVVLAHAERRDPLAIAILEGAARDVERVVTRLLDLGAPSIAMIGGLFPKMLPWLAPVLRPYLVQPEGDALEGAILMARQAATAGEGVG